MSVSSTEAPTVFRLNAVWIAYAHTFFAGGAFILALVVGCMLHYTRIVQNEHYGHPHEWFPSVSATIGDLYPERSVYQVMIAVTSGPRFLLVFLTYILTHKENAWTPGILLWTGVLRTFTCGGWTYVTSTDDHDWHDVFMISYMVLTIPWTVLRVRATPAGKARRWRLVTATLFFTMIVPLIYFFIQHKVHRIAGAYTTYAFFEWALVGLDVAFDAATAFDFPNLEITVLDPHHVVAKPVDVPVLSDPRRLRDGPPILGFVVSVLNWSVWWSVITSLGAMIWYFPLWYMGISGYEAFALTLASPLILVLPPLRRLFAAFPQLAFLGQVVAVAAYWVADPPARMMWVGIGVGFATIAFASVFTAAASSSRPGLVASQGAAFVLGLLVTVAGRIYSHTNNPIWPIMKPSIGGINPWGVAFGIGGAVCAGAMIPEAGELSKTTSKTSKTEKNEKKPAPASTDFGFTKENTSATLVGLALGAMLFIVTTFLSDASNIPLWVWEGYPLTGFSGCELLQGPTPLSHGMLVVFAMAIGLFVGVRSRWAVSKKALVLFNVAMVVISQIKRWGGFTGGLYIAFYASAILPALLAANGVHHPTKSFGVAMFVYLALIFGETWTVAYAFVPGGPALRERTWLILAFQQALVTLGAVTLGKYRVSRAVSKLAKLTGWALLLVVALASTFTAQRIQNRVAPAPVHPESHALTAGIWTIHFGLDNGLWASETRMRDLISEAELDVVGLLESDTQRIIGGHRDITQKIAEELGFYADYGPPADQHTWGAALLSRFPIVNSTHHLTPSPVGELAPAIHATLDVYGHLVDVVVFHSGQEEDPEDRRQQTAYVSELLASTGSRPTILLSYLVTEPLQGNYNTWVSDYTGMRDIDPTDDDRWCEYILYKNMRRTGYARISRDSITDTELQVGRFQVTQPENASNVRIEEGEVERGLQFPQLFRGSGVRGHRYHVFDEPRYYS